MFLIITLLIPAFIIILLQNIQGIAFLTYSCVFVSLPTKYNVGDILPVFIVEKDGKEIQRIVGEKKKEEIIDILKGCLE